MMLRSSFRRVVRLAAVAGGVGLVAVAVAQQPDKPVKPASYIPLADSTGTVKVEVSTPPVNGMEAFPKMIGEAKTAYGKVRDYAGHMARQERTGGKLQAEQLTELRVRVQPFCVNVKVTKPLSLAGEETSYLSTKTRTTVRHRPAGTEGVRGFQTLEVNDAKVLKDTRHTMTEVGVMAVLERIEKIVATEKRLNHPVQILVSDYTFGDKPVTRFEVFTEFPHPAHYAHRCVVYIDKESKLPVRFEAYDAPKVGMVEGDMIEMQSFIGLKFNVGLGESNFER